MDLSGNGPKFEVKTIELSKKKEPVELGNRAGQFKKIPGKGSGSIEAI